MKIVLTVENHPELKSEFKFAYHWRLNKIIFIQGDTEEAFITFKDDNAEDIYQMILDAYELGEESFTLNFPEEHAPAFLHPEANEVVLTKILEEFND